MPRDRFVQVTVDRQPIDLYDAADADIVINYKLEDAEDFQTKSSSEALDLKFPATVRNDQNFNTFHDPSIEDMTPAQVYRSLRSMVIIANGSEIFLGKCVLVSASHDSCPLEYEVDAYGNNGDWLIALKEATLYDFLSHINYIYTTAAITNSWNFDGRDEDLPYVYGPVRYGQSMHGLGGPTFPQNLNDVITDIDMTADYMKPSISPYWIIYWAFKSLGYKINSTFLDTDYFRRLVMPWTFESFLSTDGTQIDALKFVAKSVLNAGYNFTDVSDFGGAFIPVDLDVSNDTTSGGFDNNNTYTYDATNKEMKWQYPADPALYFGKIAARFLCRVNWSVHFDQTASSEAYAAWYLNGVEDVSKRQNLYGLQEKTGLLGTYSNAGIAESYATFDVDKSDVVSCKIFLKITEGTFIGSGTTNLSVAEFSFQFADLIIGSTINFANYISFKNYLFLDMLAGLVDFFNLIIQTDPINKVVTIEPEYPYALENDFSTLQGGYFNGHWLDWSSKQDLSSGQKSVMTLFSDYERQLTFKFRDDQNDGMLKLMQDRFTTKLGLGTYVLPDRFKTDIKNIENRFFSPVMHYSVTQWGYITGTAPQMVVMAPENIANTSASEAQNTFQPKLCWYKGLLSGIGGWMFNGEELSTYPFMFAVNYGAGGESDPILSYSDERINGTTVGKGLLKRFFWQRMAIMRNGQYYDTFFYLNNTDITNWLHREFIICRGQKWQLVDITSYAPLVDASTECNLRKWAPVSQADLNNTYPLAANILNGAVSSSGYETKYYPLIAYANDIPQTTAPVELVPTPCVAFDDGFSASFSFPDGTVGTPYTYTYVRSGYGPFTSVAPVDIPSWMTLSFTEDTITFSGTPDATGDALVEIDVTSECSEAGPIGSFTVT